jgi:hypothetical protein
VSTVNALTPDCNAALHIYVIFSSHLMAMDEKEEKEKKEKKVQWNEQQQKS